MKKYTPLLLAIILLLSACAHAAQTEETSEEEISAEETPAAAVTAVSMTQSGFEPANLTIAANTEIAFVNNDTQLHWPASGVHPTHQICPGFDSLGPVAAGASYKFTFTEAKTCPMHDHLNPQLKGSITVK